MYNEELKQLISYKRQEESCRKVRTNLLHFKKIKCIIIFNIYSNVFRRKNERNIIM